MSFKNSICVTILLLFASPLMATDLVDVGWLKENSKQVKVIDLRAKDQFQTGHIPHAINIPYGKFNRSKKNVDGYVETPEVFKSLMENHGILNSDIVVLYSDWSFLDSMRVYWIMDFYGHKNIKVLDGGIQAWVNDHSELSLVSETIVQSQYMLEINSEIITTKFRTYMASKNDNYVIVDGRDRKQFEGQQSLTSRKGHIPSAINLPWVELVKNRTEDQKFNRIKTSSTLQKINTLKDKLSIIPNDKKIILYCNGGQESSILYFALKELGKESAVYDGSWFEWSEDNKMPIAIPNVK